MYCVPFTQLCSEWLPLAVIFGAIALVILVVGIAVHAQQKDPTSNANLSTPKWNLNRPDHDSGDEYPNAPAPSTGSDDNYEPKPLNIGDRILYDKALGSNCYLVIDRVDNEENNAWGHFEIEIPAGAVARNPRYDYDEDRVTVEYKLNGNATLLRFGVRDAYNEKDDDRVSGYDEIPISGVTTVNTAPPAPASS